MPCLKKISTRGWQQQPLQHNVIIKEWDHSKHSFSSKLEFLSIVLLIVLSGNLKPKPAKTIRPHIVDASQQPFPGNNNNT
jgi:hypothetical protein